MWFCVSFGRNLRLAEHLLKLGASPQYSLYAAAYNRDAAAIRLLVRYGADIEESSGRGDTPLLGAVVWSHFEAAEAMLACGANVNAQNDRGMTAAHLMLKKNSKNLVNYIFILNILLTPSCMLTPYNIVDSVIRASL